jgi:hypothetical protein
VAPRLRGLPAQRKLEAQRGRVPIQAYEIAADRAQRGVRAEIGIERRHLRHRIPRGDVAPADARRACTRASRELCGVN